MWLRRNRNGCGPVLMLVCMAAWALLCTSTAAQSSTGGGGGGCSCDTTVSPLPSEVSIAIGVHVNASVGVISEAELAALGPDHSTFASLVNPILQGLHLYVADMRAQGAAMPLTNGNNVTFKFVWVNFGGLNLASVERLDAKGKADYLQLADTLSDPVASVALGGPFPFIIAPLFSPEDLHVALFNVCEDKMTCMSFLPFAAKSQLFTCTEGTPDCERRHRLPGVRRFNTLLTTLSESSNLNRLPLEQCHTLGVRSIAIIGEAPVGSSTFVIDTGARTKEQAEQLNIAVLDSILMELCATCGTNTHVWPGGRSAMDVALHLRAISPDALFMLFGPTPPAYPAVNALFEAMRAIDWTPRLVSWLGGGEGLIYRHFSDPSLLHYHMGVSVFDSRITSPEHRNLLTPSNFELHPATDTEDGPAVFARVFNQRYRHEYGEAGYPFNEVGTSQYPLLGYTLLVLIQKLVEHALTVDIPTLVSASARLDAPAALAELVVTTRGRIAPDTNLKQFIPSPRPTAAKPLAYNLIVPYNIGVSPVFPLPTWSERVFAPRFYSTPGEQAVVALTSLGILSFMAVLAVILRTRTQPIIRAATPSFCALVLLGAALMLSSNYFSTLHVTDAHCAASVWLLTLGFSLTFGALFVKTFRVYKLLTQKLTSVRMPERDLLLAVAAVLLVDVLINSLWSGLHGMGAALTVVDPVRPAKNYYSCDYSASLPFVYTHIATKSALLAVGVYLAWAVRRAPSHFNESTYISLCIYSVSIALCFILPILATQDGNREAAFGIRAAAVLFVSISTVTILFAPKLWELGLRRAWIGTGNETPPPNLPPQRSGMGVSTDGKINKSVALERAVSHPGSAAGSLLEIVQVEQPPPPQQQQQLLPQPQPQQQQQPVALSPAIDASPQTQPVAFLSQVRPSLVTPPSPPPVVTPATDSSATRSDDSLPLTDSTLPSELTALIAPPRHQPLPPLSHQPRREVPAAVTVSGLSPLDPHVPTPNSSLPVSALSSHAPASSFPRAAASASALPSLPPPDRLPGFPVPPADGQTAHSGSARAVIIHCDDMQEQRITHGDAR